MRMPGSKQDDGYTLIEALIALVILAVGLVGLIGLQGSALRMNSKNRLTIIGKDILVSEIERIMPLSNLELRTKTKVGDNDNRTGLASPYNGPLFSGVDTNIPTGYDYIRWKGVAKSLVVENSGNSGEVAHYLVKIAIDKKYLLQDVLARGQITVYWPVQKRGLDFLETTFFIERK